MLLISCGLICRWRVIFNVHFPTLASTHTTHLFLNWHQRVSSNLFPFNLCFMFLSILTPSLVGYVSFLGDYPSFLFQLWTHNGRWRATFNVHFTILASARITHLFLNWHQRVSKKLFPVNLCFMFLSILTPSLVGYVSFILVIILVSYFSCGLILVDGGRSLTYIFLYWHQRVSHNLFHVNLCFTRLSNVSFILVIILVSYFSCGLILVDSGRSLTYTLLY